MLQADKKGMDSARVDIYLASGKVLKIDETRIMENGIQIEDAASDSGSFSLGFTCCRILTLKLANYDQYFDTEDCTSATVIPYIINNGIEHKVGTYKVQSKNYSKGIFELTCYDNVYALENNLNTDEFELPCTYIQALRTLLEANGLSLATPTFTNDSVHLTEIDSSISTYRQLAGYIMQCAGSVLKANTEGIITVNDYNVVFKDKGNLDGGNFQNYNSGDKADGGDFTDYSTGDDVDGGAFGDRQDVEFKWDISDLTVDTKDTVITGIAATIKDVRYVVGEDGYILEISNNPLINQDNVNEILSVLKEKYAGMRFRKLSGKIRSDFRLESMDPLCVEDNKGNAYDCYLTRVTYNIGSNTSISCDCKTEEESKSTGSSTVTKILKLADSEAEKKVAEEKKLRQKAIEELTERLAKGSGLYTTEQKAEDGGYIYYTHDKPTLKESTFITKWTAEAIGLSMDGGKTYPYGFTITAKMVMDIIAVNKIAATNIEGGTLTLGGEDNMHGVLKMLNADGKEIGSWAENGIDAQAGRIGGWNIEDGMFKKTTETYIPPNMKVFETIRTALLAETADQLDKDLYDFNGDGEIDLFDFAYVKRILLEMQQFNKDTSPIAKTSEVTITINPYNVHEMISIYGVDMWGEERTTTLGIDTLIIDKVKAEKLEINALDFGKDYFFDGDPYNVFKIGEKKKSYMGSSDGTLILGNAQGDELRLQEDGNLVLYSMSGDAVWSSGTAR